MFKRMIFNCFIIMLFSSILLLFWGLNIINDYVIDKIALWVGAVGFIMGLSMFLVTISHKKEIDKKEQEMEKEIKEKMKEK